MRINIGMTAWRRPEYFAQVIERLRRCPEVLDYSCLVSVDGGHPELQAEHKKIFERSGLRGEIILQSDRLGCAGNTGWVFQNAFADSADAVIMLEDDTVPARDYLRYMRMMLERFATDEGVFDVSGYHRRVHPDSPTLARPRATALPDGMVVVSADLTQSLSTPAPAKGPGRIDGVFLRDQFTSWGWGTWRHIFDEIGEQWFGAFSLPDAEVNLRDLPAGPDFRGQIRESSRGTWGVVMQKYWQRGRLEVAPDVSRIQNIGAERGAFSPGGNFHRNNHHTEIWMDEAEYRGEFVQIAPPA